MSSVVHCARPNRAPLPLRAPDGTHPSVQILAWPEEAAREAELAALGAPRLLLVAPDAQPPADWDECTDWVRLPVDERDLCARIDALQRRTSTAPALVLDEFDVLRRGDDWTALAPIEARLVEVMLRHPGRVVSRRDLAANAWPHGMPTDRSLDTRLHGLRRRLQPLGLQVRSVRRRGLLLEDVPVAARRDPDQGQ